jgi:hypothetical protein
VVRGWADLERDGEPEHLIALDGKTYELPIRP